MPGHGIADTAIGPPALAFASKLATVSATALGDGNQVRFVRLAGIPAIPSQFGGNIMAAVGAGGPLAYSLGAPGGGFDAAYNSGSELNTVWGFLYNSGVPFGTTFDEFMGFLYGKSVNGTQTGLELIQEILDLNNRNVVLLPIVGSTEQLSGYFPEPIGHAPGLSGIGLEGLCQRYWTLRYPPRASRSRACVASGRAPRGSVRSWPAVRQSASRTPARISGRSA